MLVTRERMKSAYGMPRPVMPLFSVVTGSVAVLGYIKRYAIPAGLMRAREAEWSGSFAAFIFSSASSNFLTNFA